MNAVLSVTDSHSVGSGRFAYAESYPNLLTMEIIRDELVSNIILATIVIFVATLLLIGNLSASLQVLFW